MSTDNGDRDDGPALPARRADAGQFRKGTSGNPRGRPRKAAPPTPHYPSLYPTREFLRAEGSRPIAVTDASGQSTVSTTEAVMRSLAQKAMRGGVLATRTFMQLQMAEDERYYRERLENYEYWKSYRDRACAAIEVITKSGGDVPDICPHPDDIVLDYAILDVGFRGPITREERVLRRRAEALQALAWEMSFYTLEERSAPGPEGNGGRLGLYYMLYLYFRECLPRHLRRGSSFYLPHVMEMWRGDRAVWKRDLEARCRELGIPFRAYKRGVRAPAFPADALTYGWVDGVLALESKLYEVTTYPLPVS